MTDIETIYSHFRINDALASYSPLGNGHINTTYLIVDIKERKYVLQKINSYVFNDVGALMNNIYLVTDYLAKHGYETLTPIFTTEDKFYLKFKNDYYRLYKYIDNIICYEGIDDLKAVENTAKAFGRLHKALNDFDASTLYEVIPHFHDTSYRYKAFIESVNKDDKKRKEKCLEEIENIKKYESFYSLITNGIKNGDIHLGVTHNDPKINNILFDKDSGDIRTIVDLDTIMPGSYLYDFGDAVRSLLTGENEDSKDLSLIVFNEDIYQTFYNAYFSEMGFLLTEKEIDYLPLSVFVVAMELGMRFLKDYLDGDLYFATKYSDHNLVRARTQIRLANILFERFNLNKLNY